MWDSLESRMQNHSFEGPKNYVCDNVKGENGIILCVCVCVCVLCVHMSVSMSKLDYCSSGRQTL
jgi:hypothetical protein